MRALVLDTTLHFDEQYPDPHLTQDMTRVKVTCAGICNTDLELIKGYLGFQGVLGHEFVGIAETGDYAGRRVVGEINLACGTCEVCLRGIPTQCPNRVTMGIDRHDGVFADTIMLPQTNLHLLPDGVSDDQAVFVEPLAAGLQTLAQTHISPHDRVILIGAGKLGLLTAQVISLSGCDLTAIARHQRQFELLRQWGIHAAYQEDLAPRSADVVVDCTGSEGGFEAALKLVRARGTIHLKSTYSKLPQVNLSRAVVDEIRIDTSRCGPFPSAIRLLERGLVDVESLIEARYSLAEGIHAIEHAGRKGTLKILLDINS